MMSLLFSSPSVFTRENSVIVSKACVTTTGNCVQDFLAERLPGTTVTFVWLKSYTHAYRNQVETFDPEHMTNSDICFWLCV